MSTPENSKEKHTASVSDHPTYARKLDLDRIGLIPLSFQKYCESIGVKYVNNNRTVKSEPVRREAYKVLSRLFNKNGIPRADMDGEEVLDKDTEDARLKREQRIKLEDDKAMRRGSLVDREIVDEAIFERWLGPARTTMESGFKNLNRQIRTILQGDGTSEEKCVKAETAIFAARDATLKKMNEQIPKEKL